MKIIRIQDKKAREAMGKEYKDIEKFYIRITVNKDFYLLGVCDHKIYTLGYITSAIKLKTMLKDEPFFKHNKCEQMLKSYRASA